MSLQDTVDSLRIVLEDEETFNEVVDTVFTDLDINSNNQLDTEEFSQYIARSCAAMGIRDTPNQEQITHLFKHLDLNNDKAVTKDELAVFLKHLFREQLKDCSEKLRTKAHKPQPGQLHTPHQPGGPHHPAASHAHGGKSTSPIRTTSPLRGAPSLRASVFGLASHGQSPGGT